MSGIQNMVLAQIGIMNKLSTGNAFCDMLLCIMVPSLVGYLAKYVDGIKQWIVDELWGSPSVKESSRVIKYTAPSGKSEQDETNMRTKVLQDAILLYMGSIPNLVRKFRAAELEIIKGADTATAKNMKMNAQQGRSWNSRQGSNSDSRADEIQNFKIQITAPENVKVQISPGLFFLKATQQSSGDENKEKNNVTTFHLTSDSPDGAEKIDDFCEKALEYYKAAQAEEQDHFRYFYTPQVSLDMMVGTGGTNQQGLGNRSTPSRSQTISHKRYKLSEDKTFKSFFHPEKQALLNLLDNFINKTGKFAIAGYPQKLGLLLHGPPGTGKTSLIKAVASYTRRHVISIPLASIHSNQQLMNLVFDQKCYVQGDNWTYDMPFENSIFVMEDVDAAADVVHTRCSKDKDEMLESIAEFVASDGGKASDENDEQATRRTQMKQTVLALTQDAFEKDKSFFPTDKLNLAGILNVLDGVVDCPGRIVVMTTNHPEKLDPALIRPGRINKKIYMGMLRFEEALQMVEHYFGSLSIQDKEAFRKVFIDNEISPAALESLCADCELLVDVLDALSRGDKVEN